VVTAKGRMTNDYLRLSNRRGVTLGCLLWALVIAAGVYFGVGVAEVFVRHAKFKDAMNQELRFRAKLPDYQLKNRFAFIADSLGLPEDAGIVTITRRQGRITIESHYEETLDLPGFKKEKHFEVSASSTL
jgi:hypothetical protein